MRIKADGMKPGEVIQALEANIVAITGVGLAGIPQTNYEFHQISLLLSLNLGLIRLFKTSFFTVNAYRILTLPDFGINQVKIQTHKGIVST